MKLGANTFTFGPLVIHIPLGAILEKLTAAGHEGGTIKPILKITSFVSSQEARDRIYAAEMALIEEYPYIDFDFSVEIDWAAP